MTGAQLVEPSGVESDAVFSCARPDSHEGLLLIAAKS